MTLTPLFVVFVATAAVEIVLAGIAYSVSFRSNWGLGRQLGGLSLTGGIYTLGNAFMFVPGIPDEIIVHWSGSLNGTMAGLHAAVWVQHSYAQLGTPSTRWKTILAGVSTALGVIALIPGVFVGSSVVVEQTPFGLVTGPVLTETAQVMAAVWVAIMACVFWAYIKAARRGSSRAMNHAIAIGVFFITIVHEFALSFGFMEGMASVQFGYAVVVFVVLRDTVIELLDDSQALDALTASLSEKVNDQAKRLMDANDQLLRAERVSALGLLATNVGHELNNPLAVILASNHWLKERLADTADRDVLDAVDDTIGAADRAATIVRDLKVFAGSQDQPRLVSADVNEVVERTLRLLSLELRRAGHVSWTAKRLPPAGIDPQRLTQILLNVLVNACQSLPESRAGNNDSTIDIEASVQNDMVVIIIDDSGEGLSPDARRHMFEPFFTTKAQGKGTGLGLYVTHGLIQEVAGTIALEDNPAGRGTRVRIGIPVAGSLRNSKSPSMSGRVESARVLVVDSEPGVAKSIGYALTGYDVVALTDPTAALAALLARSQDFDVVVCGLDMPPLSGPELYRAVIAQAPHLKHRFLFLRSAGISPGVAAFAADHVEATLDKRASPHVLRRRVNSVALRPDTPNPVTPAATPS